MIPKGAWIVATEREPSRHVLPAGRHLQPGRARPEPACCRLTAPPSADAGCASYRPTFSQVQRCRRGFRAWQRKTGTTDPPLRPFAGRRPPNWFGWDFVCAPMLDPRSARLVRARRRRRPERRHRRDRLRHDHAGVLGVSNGYASDPTRARPAVDRGHPAAGVRERQRDRACRRADHRLADHPAADDRRSRRRPRLPADRPEHRAGPGPRRPAGRPGCCTRAGPSQRAGRVNSRSLSDRQRHRPGEPVPRLHHHRRRRRRSCSPTSRKIGTVPPPLPSTPGQTPPPIVPSAVATIPQLPWTRTRRPSRRRSTPCRRPPSPLTDAYVGAQADQQRPPGHGPRPAERSTPGNGCATARRSQARPQSPTRSSSPMSGR